ncbi:uncharacterized protein LOC126902823 [Daktulosphaira vitifoliae]|uniref:uncharacterized protein LOC126902823 n=1 Tax=Daktulosphaira vitifoliae TaxID=58002 RepID=UPI0021AA6EBC|nr:uncharacterized protein LOC126902823 [Daktulosphaira vitifoliae]XP_050536408.1 uncharacterized protein LOC126902823 [Daktulosphaira vitifoliae]
MDKSQKNIINPKSKVFWLGVIWLLLVTSTEIVIAQQNSPTCGTPIDKPLTASKGVITTPNFPGPFTVPIDCQWVIYIESNQENNTMTELYLTQFYVLEGFTVTEYVMYPLPDYDVPGQTKREVFNKTHMGQYVVSLLSTQQYLVIKFKLDRLEGNHVRVYNDLMDVYGFNITYEVRQFNKERNDVCSLLSCSYAGICLGNEDLSSYSCSCFPGFFGSNCGYGPGCNPENDKESCENGGVCRHAGRSIEICNCPPGFIGGQCEIPVVNFTSICGSSGNCIKQCTVPEDNPNKSSGPCPCNVFRNVSVPIDNRYQFTLKLDDMAAFESKTDIRNFLSDKLKKYFKKHSKTICSSHEDCDLRILSFMPVSGEATFELYYRKTGFKHLQEILSNINSTGYLPAHKPVPLINNSLLLQSEPMLWISKMNSNVYKDTLRVGELLMVSCIAQGSSAIQYKWYKDGYLVNTSIASTRSIWTKVIKNDKTEKNFILVIEHVDPSDFGMYTCELTDRGRQQCKSIIISIPPLPEVVVKPSITVQKGDSVAIVCVSRNEYTKFGYTWSYNNNLVPMSPPDLYWEDLHRGGIILHVKNIQRSERYTCEVTCPAGNKKEHTDIFVLNTTTTAFCDPDGVWPLTMAGTLASIDCPKRLMNYATRYCELKAPNYTEWHAANYSACVPHYLRKVTQNFHVRTLGFERESTAAKTLNSLKYHMQKTDEWYPGEGESIVEFLSSVTNFLQNSNQLEDLDEATSSFNNILDVLLKNKSIITKEKIEQIIKMIEKWVLLRAFYLVKQKNKQRLSFNIDEIFIDSASEIVKKLPGKNLTFDFFNDDDSMLTTQPPKVTVSIYDIDIDKCINKSFNVGVIIYNSLPEFFELNYDMTIISGSTDFMSLKTPLVTVSVARDGQRIRSNFLPPIETIIDFNLNLPDINGTWNLTCTVTDFVGNTWNTTACKIITGVGSLRNVTRCQCPSAGVFAVYTAIMPRVLQLTQTTKDNLIVILGCVCCLILSVLTFILLAIRWANEQTCILYLKIQLCLAIATQMCTFLLAIKINDYAYFSLCLQIVTIIEATSHLSQVLIVYTEIISFPSFPTIKLSIIGVATAAPILFVLSIMLSLNIVGVNPIRPWINTSAFLYIYFVLFILLLLMYVSVLVISISKINFIKEKLHRNTPCCLNEWIGLIKRSIVILLMVIITTMLSILYFLYSEELFKHSFSISCALKGFVVLVCYVFHTEESFNLISVYLLKSTNNRLSGDIHLDVNGSPSNDLSKNAVDCEINNKSTKCDIIEISDNPTDYFTAQEQPTSVISNLTSSLKRASGQNLESKTKSVTFLHDLVTGCQEKPFNNNNTLVDDDKCLSYKNSSRAPLLETTKAEVVHAYGDCDLPELCSNSSEPEEQRWQVVQTGFDVAANVDTAIRCVVQPPPDMMATHVCVEVELVKSSAAVNNDLQLSVPTVVVCSVDVEPCRVTPSQVLSPDDKLKSIQCENWEAIEEHVDQQDDTFDRITQDLDYLLNRKNNFTDNSPYVCMSPSSLSSNHQRKNNINQQSKDEIGVTVQKQTNENSLNYNGNI